MADTINSKSETNIEVATEIKDLFMKRREALGLNVRELGRLAEVSYTVIYDLEKRTILPKMETLIKLAEALGFTVNLKQIKDEKSPALSIVFHIDNVNDKKFLFDGGTAKPKLTTEEQLRKLLNLKGLYTDEVTEIENYIAFKLSQH